jgi:hypothetical protein
VGNGITFLKDALWQVKSRRKSKRILFLKRCNPSMRRRKSSPTGQHGRTTVLKPRENDRIVPWNFLRYLKRNIAGMDFKPLH